MRLCAHIRKSEGKEVIRMQILNGSILLLAAMNLAVNTGLGMMILLNCPHDR